MTDFLIKKGNLIVIIIIKKYSMRFKSIKNTKKWQSIREGYSLGRTLIILGNKEAAGFSLLIYFTWCVAILRQEGIHTCTSPVCPAICTETLTLWRQQPGPAVPAPEPERGPGSLDAASQDVEKWPRRHITPLYAEML